MFACDQSLDEFSILIRDLYAVLLDEIIKHHLGGVFVLPLLVLAVEILWATTGASTRRRDLQRVRDE